MSSDPTDWIEMTMMLATSQGPSQHLDIIQLSFLSFCKGGTDILLCRYQRAEGPDYHSELLF